MTPPRSRRRTRRAPDPRLLGQLPEVKAPFTADDLEKAWQTRRDRLGVVPWCIVPSARRPWLWPEHYKHLAHGTLEALAATTTSAEALRNLFDNRQTLDDRVVFALMRNPALPNRCFPEALAEGLYDTVLNPTLPLFLIEHPEQLERIELMLTWLVGAMAASCPTVPGQAIVRDWTAAVAMALSKKGRGKGKSKGQRKPPGNSLLTPPVPLDEYDWRLVLPEGLWLDAEFLPGFVMHMARRHHQPSAAALALAQRLRRLQRRFIGPGSPAEIDQFIDRMDELLGTPRLTDAPPAPPIPEQLELVLAKAG